MATKLSNWTMRAGRTADFDGLSGYAMLQTAGRMTWFNGISKQGAFYHAKTTKNVEWVRGFVIENDRRVVLA